MAIALLVSLKTIVQIDPTVLEVADLPPGWQATRDTAESPWKRSLCPPSDEADQ